MGMHYAVLAAWHAHGVPSPRPRALKWLISAVQGRSSTNYTVHTPVILVPIGYSWLENKEHRRCSSFSGFFVNFSYPRTRGLTPLPPFHPRNPPLPPCCLALPLLFLAVRSAPRHHGPHVLGLRNPRLLNNGHGDRDLSHVHGAAVQTVKKAKADLNKKAAPVVNTKKLDEAAEPVALDWVSTEVKQLIQKAQLEKKMSLGFTCLDLGFIWVSLVWIWI
ncbi:hypothetical protein SO802_027087 [Lithocarpus litseifolius]|uniref:Multiprotein bridging factor 1 N-terminal domain-containing protein n=1 Tax=Lithocarpus litseifolius TaxID=425828 RepID=A0AAW2C442_9ROSI